MKHSLLGALILAGALAACSGSSLTGSDATSLTAGSRVTLRYVNSGWDGPTDLYVNSVLKMQTQVPPGAVDSVYLWASSVPQAVAVTMTGPQRLVLASAPITFAVDTPYTVVFSSGGGHLLVLPDTVSAPPLGVASFRLVKVASGIWSPVDVYRTTGSADLTDLTPVASNVADETSSPYVPVPAGPSRIIVTMTGNPNQVLFDSGIHTFSMGEAWTMLLMYKGAGGVPVTFDMWIKDRS